MAKANTAKEFELLLDIMRYGTLNAVNVDWAAIDKKNGSKNKNPGGTS